jgi:hypothetical protein
MSSDADVDPGRDRGTEPKEMCSARAGALSHFNSVAIVKIIDR